MKKILLYIFSILVTAGFVGGNFLNGFIVLVNCRDWVQRRQIFMVDGILTGLALSKIGTLWVTLINWYAGLFFPPLANIAGGIGVNISWSFCHHFSLWLATSLSIFYLLKVANFSSLLFLNLKRRVKSVVFITLLGSLSLLGTHIAVTSRDENVWIEKYKRNSTQDAQLRDLIRLSSMISYTVENLIPFTVSLACFLLLIFSLVKHLKQMQLSGKRARDPSTGVHIRALQSIISFLLLFACYFLALVVLTWSSDRMENKVFVLTSQVLIEVYPSVHSIFLIWGNKKLKEAFLWQLRYWQRERQ